MDLQATFEKFEEEFLNFGRIENPKHPRPDLCAFIMLHELVPATGDMVNAAERDEIFLAVDCEELAEKATDDFIRDLARCGVRYDDVVESLVMFV